MMMKDVLRAMLDGRTVGCRSAYTETHYRMDEGNDLIFVKHSPDGEWKPMSSMLLEPFKEWFVVEDRAITFSEAMAAMFEEQKECSCDARPGKIYRVAFLKLCECRSDHGQIKSAVLDDEMYSAKWRVVG